MTKHWNQLRQTAILVNKLWYLHTMEYYEEVNDRQTELTWKSSPLKCVNKKSTLHEWSGCT